MTWDQISALHNRVTGAQGRYDRAAKKVAQQEKALKESSDDESLKVKLESSRKSLGRAEEELKLMNDLSARVAVYKKPKGENHG